MPSSSCSYLYAPIYASLSLNTIYDFVVTTAITYTNYATSTSTQTSSGSYTSTVDKTYFVFQSDNTCASNSLSSLYTVANNPLSTSAIFTCYTDNSCMISVGKI